MDLLQRLAELLRGTRLFRRRRTDALTKALAVLAYHGGLSLRRVAGILRRRRSHEAVRRWVRRCRELFPPPEKRERRALAIDETEVKVRGRWVYVGAAIDGDRWEVLAPWATEGRSLFEALSFLRKALSYCDGMRTVYVEGAWYRWALEGLGVPWEDRTFGPRAPVEQWYGIYKHRIRRFYRRWPHNASLDQADAWTRSFVSCYNLRRMEGLS